jgi:hypothetical protein
LRGYDEIIQTKCNKIALDDFKKQVEVKHPDIDAFNDFSANAKNNQK